MPHGQFPGQSVPVSAGSGVPAHEAGVLLATAGERDCHPSLGEEDLLTWSSQVEGKTCEILLSHPAIHQSFSLLIMTNSILAVIRIFHFLHLDSLLVSLQVWEFSHLFSAVDSWHLADTPPISAHLNVCPYYETSPHSERVALPGMTEKRGASEERLSLIKHFTGNRNRWQQ